MEEKITTSKGLSPRSGEVQEIMGRAPHWTLRWGMLLIGVVFAGLAAGSWFFRYPDVLQAPCTVTPALLPEEILLLTGNDTEDYFLLKKEDRHRSGPQ